MRYERYKEDDELIQDIHESIRVKLGKKKIRILVFGPDINEKTPSAKLRKYIIKKCRKDNYTVVLSEHQEIIQLYEKIFRSANDLCNMEYHLARDIVDGIVIIPDSAGSFIELGMFTLDDSLHDKILILFNKAYQSNMSGNFIGLGAKSAYDNGNAKTRVLSYGQKKVAWDEVSGFLDFRKGKRYWKKVKGEK